MPNHTSLASLFGDIADAIRAKTGGSNQIEADSFPAAITAIPSARVGEATASNSSDSQSISFSVEGEPILFACVPTSPVTLSFGTKRLVTGIIKAGDNINHGVMVGGGSNFSIRTNQCNVTYSNGTVTLQIFASNGGAFLNGVTYRLLYTY